MKGAQTEAFNRLEHVATLLLEARDSVKEAQLAFSLERGYQAHRLADVACAALYTAMDDIRAASLIGQAMARDKSAHCETPQFKEPEQ